MILYNKNQSWTPPEGYNLKSVKSEGAYLQVVFIKPISKPGWKDVYSEVIVYANDVGREVMRTEASYGRILEEEIKKPIVIPIKRSTNRWQRFCTGCYLILAGLQEMSRCHKK